MLLRLADASRVALEAVAYRRVVVLGRVIGLKLTILILQEVYEF